jgi:CubicO group peptidase (beta-lactamase class C family)
MPGPVAAALVEFLNDHGIKGEETITARLEDYVYLTPVNILPAWGGIWSTAEDAARFGGAFLNGGKGSDARILEKKTVKQMLHMQKSTTGKPLGIGLGWILEGSQRERTVKHGGGGPGINALLKLYPSQDLTVAILGSMGGYPADRIVGYAADILSKSSF